MKTVSINQNQVNRRGRPRSAFHAYKEKFVLSICDPDASKATRRNTAYMSEGLGLLKEMNLRDKLLGNLMAGDARRGWQGFCVEVGRWVVGGHDVKPLLAHIADDDPDLRLSHAARILKHMRLGVRKPDVVAVTYILRRAVIGIRRKYPSVTAEMIREGLHEIQDDLPELCASESE